MSTANRNRLDRIEQAHFGRAAFPNALQRYNAGLGLPAHPRLAADVLEWVNVHVPAIRTMMLASIPKPTDDKEPAKT